PPLVIWTRSLQTSFDNSSSNLAKQLCTWTQRSWRLNPIFDSDNQVKQHAPRASGRRRVGRGPSATAARLLPTRNESNRRNGVNAGRVRFAERIRQKLKYYLCMTTARSRAVAFVWKFVNVCARQCRRNKLRLFGWDAVIEPAGQDKSRNVAANWSVLRRIGEPLLP